MINIKTYLEKHDKTIIFKAGFLLAACCIGGFSGFIGATIATKKKLSYTQFNLVSPTLEEIMGINNYQSKMES